MLENAEMMKMTETLAHEYSSESTQQEISNEYQHDTVKKFFKNLCTCASDESTLSIGKVKGEDETWLLTR